MFAFLLLLIPSVVATFIFSTKHGGSFASTNFDSNLKFSNYFASSHAISYCSTMVHNSLSKSVNYFSLASSTPYLTMVHNSLSKTKSVNYFSLLSTIAPSPMPVISVLSFETALSLSGLSEPVLDDPAQTAVTVAVANSANVSAKFVIFVKQRPMSSNVQKYLFELESPTYAIEATTQLNIPVSGANPNTLYSTLTNSIVVAVGNGDFNAFLVAASIAVNSTSTQNAVSTDVVVTPMIILVPSPMPTPLPSVNPSVFISTMPSRKPSPMPSLKPSPAPRYKPSRKPSPNPSPMPSKIPFQSSHSQKKSEEVALFIMIGFIVLCVIVYFYVKRRDQNHIILDIQDI
jgi:hypothetical protein